MSKPLKVTEENFKAEVLESDLLVFVDFWAEWCGPCKMIAPVIDELADEYEGKFKFTKLDVDEHPAVATQYGIRSIPALLIFKEGTVVGQTVGAQPKKSLKKFLDKALA